MSTAETIKTFNSIIESFLLQTSELVGTTYYTYFKKVIKVNALIAIESAINYMLPYKDKIFIKDETYFTNEVNYIDKVNNTSISTKFSNDKVLSEIFRLKNIYYKLNAESKENVWAILQALVQLTLEYCQLKGITISE
jgi:hypothetical protein